MRKDDLNLIRFAGIVCVACSFVLALTATGLKSRQEANKSLYEKQNVLKAFGVDTTDEAGEPWSRERTLDFFRERIQVQVVDAASGKVIEGLTLDEVSKDDLKSGAKRPLYVIQDDGGAAGYAFPISGKGLWSTIYGFLALEPDLATIRGITFYQHGETPGLGGEVETDWFTSQFQGKKVFSGGSLQTFQVVKGAVSDRYPEGNDHAVDGISAATITSRGVQRFLNQDVAAYEPYFRTIRGI